MVAKTFTWLSDCRYYSVRVQRDLLGDWTMVKRWGGRGNNLGGEEVSGYPTLAAVFDEVRRIDSLRRRHHYHRVR